jgi:hypothetical protein
MNRSAFRYEPGYDFNYIQSSTAFHPTAIIDDPDYMPNELATSKTDSQRQGNLTLDDIDSRKLYYWIPPGAVSSVPIASGDGCTTDGCITADNIVRSNAWANFKVNPDEVDLDFAAQTTIASSYGYMQIMLQVAMEEEWESPSGANHPVELFLPNENILTATKHLQKLIQLTFDDSDPEVELPIQIVQSLRLALQRYNGGSDPNYSSKVFNFVPQYRPLPNRPIFPSQ